MENRRDFLKIAATGALALGAQSKLGLAAGLDQHAQTGKSKVVIARDAALHGTGAQPDEKRVAALLDRAIAPTRAASTRSKRGGGSCRKSRFRRQGHRPQGQRPRRQGNQYAPCADDGRCRTAATDWRQARKHSDLGPE